MKKKYKWIIVFCVVCMITGCTPKIQETEDKVVLCTSFAAYDWTRQLLRGCEGIRCELLVDTGVDLHSYQPTAQDIMRIANCDVLIYVGGESDTWVKTAMEQSGNKDIISFGLMEFVGDLALDEVHIGEHAHHHEHEGHEEHADMEEEIEKDEHVWLSFTNAKACCKKLAGVLSELQPSQTKQIQQNLTQYQSVLSDLDLQLEQVVSKGKKDMILIADRFAFLYLLNDYDLGYHAAFSGCSADAEVDVSTVTDLVDDLRNEQLSVIFVADNSPTDLADTIIESAGMDVEVLRLYSMQGVNAEEIDKGNTYVSYMKENICSLAKALESEFTDF